MKQDPTRWFLIRVALISATAILIWAACFVAGAIFCFWAVQSLLNDQGAGIPSWLVIELGACVGFATVIVALVLKVAAEPRQLAHRSELVETPRHLSNLVEGIALAVGVPTPEVLLIEDSCPNAAAAGSRKRSIVVVTTGLLDLLRDDEIEAVMGHVLSRLDTHAVTLATMAAALTGDILQAHDYARGQSWPTQIWAVGFGYPVVLCASVLRWWALHDEAQVSDLHALRTVRNPDALLRSMEKLIADESEPRQADLGNAHLWFEYPAGAVGDLPGPSARLDARLVLSARVEKLTAALGAGFIL